MDSSQLKTLLLSTLSRRRCSLITVRDSPALFPAAVCLPSVSVCCISSGVYDCDGWISPSGGSVIITPRCPLLALQKIKMLAHHFFFLFLLLLPLQWEDLFIVFGRHTCSCMYMLLNIRRIRRRPRQPCQVINSQTFHLDSLPAKWRKVSSARYPSVGV